MQCTCNLSRLPHLILKTSNHRKVARFCSSDDRVPTNVNWPATSREQVSNGTKSTRDPPKYTERSRNHLIISRPLKGYFYPNGEKSLFWNILCKRYISNSFVSNHFLEDRSIFFKLRNKSKSTVYTTIFIRRPYVDIFLFESHRM